jgi:uncharacterized membrane protein YagU involved in acid resistance
MAQEIAATNGPLNTSTDWHAALWAALIAGLAFMMMEMGLVWLIQGQSPWAPPHMIAAIAWGEKILPLPGTWAAFNGTVLMTAMMIHMLLSVVLGMLGAQLLRGAGMGRGLVVGAVFGLAIYVVNFYFIAPLAFPWFVMARNWISAFSHIMFGFVFALTYIVLRRSQVAQTL